MAWRVSKLLGPFARRRRTLVTRLTPDECAARLERALGPRQRFGRRPGFLQGGATPRRFSLTREPPGERNSLRTFARGTFVPHDGGTRIDVVLGMHPAIAVLMAAWLGGSLFLAAIDLRLATVVPGMGPEAGAGWTSLFPPLPLVAFVAGLVALAVGRRATRGLDRRLYHFVRRRLDAFDPRPASADADAAAAGAARPGDSDLPPPDDDSASDFTGLSRPPGPGSTPPRAPDDGS